MIDELAELPLRLDADRARVNAELEELFLHREAGAVRLEEAMRYGVLGNGKRRAALLSACSFAGQSCEGSIAWNGLSFPDSFWQPCSLKRES